MIVIWHFYTVNKKNSPLILFSVEGNKSLEHVLWFTMKKIPYIPVSIEKLIILHAIKVLANWPCQEWMTLIVIEVLSSMHDIDKTWVLS